MRPLGFGQAILLGLLLLSSSNKLSAAASDEANIEIPDLEFLEFLGQFQTDEGEWINPISLNTDEFDEILDAATGAFSEVEDPEGSETDNNASNRN